MLRCIKTTRKGKKVLLLLLLVEGEEREIAAMTWLQAASKISSDLINVDPKTLIEAGYGRTSDVVARIAAARKTTANTVRRQLTACAFLKSTITPKEFEILVKSNTPPPFNTIEALKKLHAVDPHGAQALLPKALARTLTFAQVNEQYETALANTREASSPFEMRRNSSTAFEKEVLDVLGRTPDHLYPGGHNAKVVAIQSSIPGFFFALPDGIATFREDAFRYDGIEIRMPTDGARHQVWQTLERLQLMSTFFTHTWLILPSPVLQDQTAFIDTLLKAKTMLGLPSVGIATAALGDTAEFKIWIQPTGLPEIDRRHLLPPL